MTGIWTRTVLLAEGAETLRGPEKEPFEEPQEEEPMARRAPWSHHGLTHCANLGGFLNLSDPLLSPFQSGPSSDLCLT